MTLPKAWMSWSTGKDSAWALEVTRRRGEVEIVALVTTVNAAYARVAMHAVREGVTRMVFGDLFLADIRRYREQQLSPTGITPIFPLWQLDTRELAREMVRAGLGAFLTCIDPKKLDRSFAGREFNQRLLDELPPDVDPCGENGEFHTFAYRGPMFAKPISVATGEIVERDGFVFADLLAV